MSGLKKNGKNKSTESKLVHFIRSHDNTDRKSGIKTGGYESYKFDERDSNFEVSKMSIGGAGSNLSCATSHSEESNEMVWNTEKSRKWDPWEDGEYGKPNGDEPNEVNFLGGLGPNVGHPRSTMQPKRPTAIQKIYNMRTRNQPVFTFCENPRKANNVVRKKEKCDHTNIKLIASTVDRIRLVQNVETPPPSEFSEDPTEVGTHLSTYV